MLLETKPVLITSTPVVVFNCSTGVVVMLRSNLSCPITEIEAGASKSFSFLFEAETTTWFKPISAEAMLMFAT